MNPSETPAEARVAVIMRTKNRPLLLRRAIDDVLGQTSGDWVLVVVNDGGDPKPVDELVARVADRARGRIAVVHNAESVGMEAASNVGLRSSRSEYVVIHDDDDGWHPEFLARTVAHLDRTGAAGVMVRTEIVYERIVGDRIEVVGRELLQPDVFEITLFDMLRINRAVPISFLYRRSAHEEVGLYEEDLSVVGDWAFHLKFLMKYAIEFLDGDVLAYWNQRRDAGGDLGNSVFSRSDDHRKFDLLLRERYLKQDLQEWGLGAMLYLTKISDRDVRWFNHRLDRIEANLEELQRAVRDLGASVDDSSLLGLLRRRYRRLKDRARPRT